ncbi:hypothetical protein GCM10023199_27060 [Actinomycetospora chibensis]
MTPATSGESPGVSPAVPPGAVLMVRVWFDEGDLRVRLTATDDLEGPAHTLGVAGDVDGACDLVRTWLTAVAAGGRGA